MDFINEGWLNGEEGYGTYISPVEDMDRMIRGIYSNMLKEEGCKDKISRETMEEAKDFLAGLEKLVGTEDYARCRDGVFLVASAAEENGFVEGFRYAFRLFAECMHE